MTRALDILVVTGERPIADSLVRALAHRGHAVRTAASAEDVLVTTPPDVLLCDFDQAGLGALGLLEALRERGTTLRAVLFGDAPRFDDCRAAFRLGAADFLEKPFGGDELAAAVEGDLPARDDIDSDSPWTFRRVFDGEADSVECALRGLLGFLARSGVGPTTRVRTLSATAEALDNAIRHAHPDAIVRVHLTADLDDRDLVVEVSDEGLGFEPLDPARVVDAEESGLARAAALAEDLHVESSDEGTTVTLRFTAFEVHYDQEDTVDLSELDWIAPSLARRILGVLRDPELAGAFELSPSLAVAVGRLLAGPRPELSVQMAFRS